ncbi:hypothetical protein EW026_g6866 [Hermanssonia centrifuga]|uniref:MYND-type domain-containing protein n=1 Tax=Hermanssonia centrifuga TaxID=98765 RepID=A0A4V3X9M2_9APHY|nr:hypothetical protein EW026_g6866 [Hermanssonia centrifuga]
MEDRRRWCPDSTSKYLASQNGDAFLRMLKGLLPTDLYASISVPIDIPHPVVDRFFTLSPADERKPGFKTIIWLYRLSRIYCLTTIVWNTFLAFYGEKETQLAIKPPKADLAAAAKFREDPQRLNSTQVRDVMKQHNTQRKAYDHACWKCSKSERMFEPGQKLQACSKCRAINRLVFYCSRQCQLDDWKNGVPVPHKQICGKLMNEDSTVDSVLNSDEVEVSWLPKADASYKRSPALLHQISLLRQGDGLDYVFVLPGSTGDDVGARFWPIEEKIQFLIQRNRAFRTGDPGAVSKMFLALCGVAATSSVPVSNELVRNQLENEYGVVLSKPLLSEEGPEPTSEEIMFAMLGLKDQIARSNAASATASA